MRRRLIVIIAIAITLVVAVVYYVFDPSAGEMWFPRCTLYTLTGLRCPGCGMQRAAHAMLHGDIMGALRYNAMIPIIAVGLATLAYGELVAAPESRIARVVRHPATAITAVVIIVAWGVVRNLLGI